MVVLLFWETGFCTLIRRHWRRSVRMIATIEQSRVYNINAGNPSMPSLRGGFLPDVAIPINLIGVDALNYTQFNYLQGIATGKNPHNDAQFIDP